MFKQVLHKHDKKNPYIYLYYVKTNSYTKFQVNISIDGKHKSGKLNLNKGQ